MARKLLNGENAVDIRSDRVPRLNADHGLAGR
jgi:hypothetical protein